MKTTSLRCLCLCLAKLYTMVQVVQSGNQPAMYKKQYCSICNTTTGHVANAMDPLTQRFFLIRLWFQRPAFRQTYYALGSVRGNPIVWSSIFIPRRRRAICFIPLQRDISPCLTARTSRYINSRKYQIEEQINLYVIY